MLLLIPTLVKMRVRQGVGESGGSAAPTPPNLSLWSIFALGQWKLAPILVAGRVSRTLCAFGTFELHLTPSRFELRLWWSGCA
jgi:hypothetical protein